MAISFKKLKTEYDFLDTMPFGNYRGKTISWIIEFDPEYLDWCSKQQGLLYLSNKCKEQLLNRVCIAKANREIQLSKKISKELHFAHSDQDDWWEDVPF
jgi:hypothetical protein